ncbi:MAG: prepilin-type N-terminal cleavage/methylation domain-containing protein [Planctomycetes bacterium]|nr:prepilin-type N-terminal cleavage/methylation domain-containing protein [Planctomycetota bacterium]
MMRTQYNGHSNGFTLIEVLFAAMLIGLVIAAIAVSSSASTMVNGVGLNMSTAEFLIEEIREQTASMTFDEVVIYTASPINPPIDLSGAPMAEFSAFSQQVTVEYVNPANLTQVSGTATDFVRVTVTITKNNVPVSSANWLRTRL